MDDRSTDSGLPLDRLLALAYACGWCDAFSSARPTIAHAQIAELIERIAIEWQAQMISRTPEAPEWLRKEQDKHKG